MLRKRILALIGTAAALCGVPVTFANFAVELLEHETRPNNHRRPSQGTTNKSMRLFWQLSESFLRGSPLTEERLASNEKGGLQLKGIMILAPEPLFFICLIA